MGTSEMSLANHVSSGITLAQFMQELGYGATISSNVFTRVLEHVSASLSEDEVAGALVMMIRTYSGLDPSSAIHSLAGSIFAGVDAGNLQRMSTWDLEVFASAVLQKVPFRSRSVY